MIWYYIETRYALLLKFLGIKKNSDVIPHGAYCYVPDDEKNAKTPFVDGGTWIKPCKYYRTNKDISACTYTGKFGYDILLDDMCKICGENEDSFI